MRWFNGMWHNSASNLRLSAPIGSLCWHPPAPQERLPEAPQGSLGCGCCPHSHLLCLGSNAAPTPHEEMRDGMSCLLDRKVELSLFLDIQCFLQTFQWSCPCSASSQGITGPSSQTMVPWQHSLIEVWDTWAHLAFTFLPWCQLQQVSGPETCQQWPVVLCRGLNWDFDVPEKPSIRKRDGGGECAEFYSAMQNFQVSCLGTGDTALRRN